MTQIELPSVDLPSFGKWMLTLTASILVIGAASAGTLNLIASHSYRTPDPAPTPVQAKMVAPIPKTAVLAAALPIAAPAPAPAASPVPEPTPKAADLQTAKDAPPQMMATLGLAVRAHPDKYSPQVAAIEQGEIVTVGNKQGGWLLVTLKSGESGWAYGKYLHAVDPQIAADSPFWQKH